MKVYCKYCQTRCRIDEAKMPPAGAHVRCPACQKIFFLNPGKSRVKEENRETEPSLLPPPDEGENIEPREAAPTPTEESAPGPAGPNEPESVPETPAPESAAGRNDSSRLTGLIFSRPLVISIAVAILIEILLVFLWATGRQPVIQSKNSVLSTPVVASSIKSQAIKTIVSHALVGDAAIEQQKNVLTLTLLVDQSTPPAYALKMGRRFVATLKKLTGTGNSAAPAYQFHLFIYYPNGQEVTNQLSTTDNIRNN